MGERQTTRILKRDVLGSVELVEVGKRRAVRRSATGSRLPLSRAVACWLLRRERRALRRLEGLEGVPRLLDTGVEGALTEGGVLLRTYLEGVALHDAAALPRDFFERLEDLVGALHERGVCHNDLHKEANVVVRSDGRPGLVDFQLASIHPRRGRTFRVRAAEDLRHVAKHRRHYELATGTRSVTELPSRRPSRLAAAWMRFAKPLYNALVHRVVRWRDREGRRAEGTPPPVWTDPVGRPGSGGEGP